MNRTPEGYKKLEEVHFGREEERFVWHTHHILGSVRLK